MKISAFTITTNALMWQFPVVESIKSVLPMVDEVVVVDGGSTDKTVETLRRLSDKVRVICDKDTIWEDDWTYWRMGHNLDRAFMECTGDWIAKFDTDYVFQGRFDLRKELRLAGIDGYHSLNFDRYNFMMVDRYFMKKQKTMFVNMELCKKEKLNIRWGYELKNTGLGDGPIVLDFKKDNINHGKMLNTVRKYKTSAIEVFNYAYCFRDEKKSKELMFRNMRAMRRQSGESVKDRETVFDSYKKACLSAFDNSKQYPLKFERHPIIIQDKIRNLTPEYQGFNFWGAKENAGYYNKNSNYNLKYSS